MSKKYYFGCKRCFHCHSEYVDGDLQVIPRRDNLLPIERRQHLICTMGSSQAFLTRLNLSEVEGLRSQTFCMDSAVIFLDWKLAQPNLKTFRERLHICKDSYTPQWPTLKKLAKSHPSEERLHSPALRRIFVLLQQRASDGQRTALYKPHKVVPS